jgi:arsenate reductase
MRGKTRILFPCMYNAAHSHLAEDYMRAIAGREYEVASTGTDPAYVNPLAIRAMQEVGIDISGHTAKGIKPFLGDVWHYVITVYEQANEDSPDFPVSVATSALGIP